MANDHGDVADVETKPKGKAVKDHGNADLGSKRIYVADDHGGHGGGAMKWLAGAAVAALVVGGGYWFMHNPAPTPSNQAALSQDVSDANNPAPENPIAQPATTLPHTSSVAPHRAVSHEAAEGVVGVSSASAATGDGDEIIVPGARRPVWAQRPSARRLSEAYPYQALEAGQEGEARVTCVVGRGGRLGCVKVSETPAHEGFGAAAVRVAEMYRHAGTRADGSAAEGTAVNLRVLFRVGQDGRRFN